MKQIFEILLLKLDLDITRNAIICQDCMEVSINCLNFKYTCIDAEQFILSHSTDVKLDIKVIYEEKECVRIVFDEGFNICRLCMTRLDRNNFTSLDVLSNESTLEMLSAYMVEIDFNSIENPLVCANCKENSDGYLKFVLSCQDMEEKIKVYCKEKGTDTIGPVNLSNVLLFMFTDVLEYPDRCFQTSKIEQDHTVCEYPEAYMGLLKQEEVDIIEEEMIVDETYYRNASEIKLDRNGDTCPLDMLYLNSGEHSTYQNNIQANNIMADRSFDWNVLEMNGNEAPDMRINKPTKCADGTKQNKHTKSDLNDSDASEVDVYEHKLYTSETKQRHVLKKHTGTCKVALGPKQKHKIAKRTSDLQSYISVDGNLCPIYKCSLCTYEDKQKSNFTSHMLVHKDLSEIKTFKCSLCAYEAKHKGSLNLHMQVHKDASEIKMFKCSLCTFESKHKSSLIRHMIVHKDTSKTKHKRTLNMHMLVHKDVSEIKMFKCSLCAYEAKQKSNLIRHMIIHKDLSEKKMYKCSLCAYKAKQKSNLTSHMLVHKEVSEIKMYKCLLCPYETKLKGSLNLHMLVHKDASEIKMFKCSLCAYEAKHKSSLIRHTIVHKDTSEIEMFNCSLCAYEAKHKSYLIRHMIVHKDTSEIKMYNCPLCVYEAKRKGDLTSHMLVHNNNNKDVSDIKMFKCSLCAYEAKHKSILIRHTIVHKDTSEIEMFKCSLCAYEAKHKSYLIRHMIVHKDASEVKLYKCSLCTYEGKRKSNLKNHILVHKHV